MDDPAGKIFAGSRQQAMDWSLVLASQGILCAIEALPDPPEWCLIVPETQLSAARKAIRLYQRENRFWAWPHPLAAEGRWLGWSGAAWSLLLIAFYGLEHALHMDLRSPGIMDNTSVSAGEWWRLFTAVLLHGDLAHLAANATTGAVLLGLASGRYGAGVGLLIAFFCGVIGNMAGWVYYTEMHRGLGASGMILGALGMIAAPSWENPSHWFNRPKLILKGTLAGILLFTLLGLTPGTDLVAHTGGFVGGFLVGSLVTALSKWQTRFAKSPVVNLAAGMALAALIIGAWRLAFTGGKLF